MNLIARRIRELREKHGMSQTDLAETLHTTRSTVNSWEQDISIPSTRFVVEMADLFHVSTDYLLREDPERTLNTSGLNQADLRMLTDIIRYMRRRNRESRAFSSSDGDSEG